MNKKLIIGIIAVLVAFIASVAIFKDSKSEAMKPKYSQKIWINLSINTLMNSKN